jgi:quercetin dioxygenase-like cupin family protein
MFKAKSFVFAMVIIVGGYAAAVLATAGFGSNGVVQARAAFRTAVDIKVKVDEGRQDVIHVPNARDTVIQQVVFDPGGHSGWHSHPGPAIVLVKSGTLTLYDGDDRACVGRSYSAGQAFVDPGQGHVHLAGNLSEKEKTEVWVTYLDVPPGASPRIDQPNPQNCPF